MQKIKPDIDLPVQVISTENSAEDGRKPNRLLAVDALRGLIIILMALDHANYFIAQQHSSGEYWGGSFPFYQDVLPFLTRFVTHFCAPGFFFLMGIGMHLFAESRRRTGRSEWAITRHFLLRGALLIALQLLVVNRLWEFSPGGWGLEIYIGVLFSLGIGMILGSFLLRMNPAYLLAIAFALLIGTELLVPSPADWGQPLSLYQNLLLVAGDNSPGLWVNYPALAWLELVLFGLTFGSWLAHDRKMAFRRAFYLGLGFLLAFAVVRTLDGFGNLRPRAGDSWMDFLNPVKYPPSITFTLMTIGVNLIILRVLDWISQGYGRFLKPLVVFGKTPLLFYILHLFLYAGMGRWFAPDGTSLPVMYIYWLLGVLILYPICLWYGRFKNRQPENSVLRYF